MYKKKYSIIFSNSTIEHVGSYESQKIFANQIRTNSKKYFVQTPNFNFPVEPHYLFPFFQFLPISFKIIIAKYWPFGWYYAKSDTAVKDAKTIRLLKMNELKVLFPDGQILFEKLFGLTKSFYVLRV